MLLSGIDISVFKPHSTRAASTSAATQAEQPVSDILKVAGWSLIVLLRNSITSQLGGHSTMLILSCQVEFYFIYTIRSYVKTFALICSVSFF